MNILELTKTKLENEIKLIGNETNNKVLVIGVFHGDEPQGKHLIEKYLELKKSSNLLFIPCLNPDGMSLNKRVNANGVDLNRNFPTENWSGVFVSDDENPECLDSSNFYGGEFAGSETETKFVIDIIEKYRPKFILTLHAPYKIVNYDGPAEGLAQKISEIIKYPVEPSIGYPTPGSFGAYCGVERNIPIVTLELDEEIPVAQLEQPVFEIFDMLSIIF